MRKAILFAALVTVAGTAAGQTKIATRRTTQDSVRVLDARSMSPDEVRALATRLKALSVQRKRYEEMYVRGQRDSSDVVLRMPDGDLMRNLVEMADGQAKLSVACDALRPVPGQGDGYIGIDISQIVMGEIRAGIEAPVERFARPPVISAVKTGSPAAQAGLRAGDEWLAIERRDLVGSSVGDVMALVKPGARVELRVRRDGKAVDVPVSVLKRPEYPADVCDNDGTQYFAFSIPWQVDETPPFKIQQRVPMTVLPRTPMPQTFTFMYGDRTVLYGATFRVLTDDQRKALQVTGDGILVDEVRPRSPAEAAGLRAFDVVIRANGDAVKSLKDLLRVNGPDGLVLGVINHGEMRTVKLGGQ